MLSDLNVVMRSKMFLEKTWTPGKNSEIVSDS